MDPITSKAIQRQYGRVRAQALREPVVITHHGREDMVLLSAAEFKRLKRRDREVLLVKDLDNETLKAILEAEPPEEASNYDNEVDG